MSKPKPANFVAGALPARNGAFRYTEKSNPENSNLDFLSYGVCELSGAVVSKEFNYASDEALLFCWKGAVMAKVNGQSFQLNRYDVLYVPRGATYQLEQKSGESKVIVCRATADKVHPPFHAKWKEVSKD